MSIFTKIKLASVLLFIVFGANAVLAQTKADIFDVKVPVTWLGLDYSQAKFIPAEVSKSNATPGATRYSKPNAAPEVTNDELLHKYIPAWNYLFMIQVKKFDVAQAIHHPAVINAISVTENVNSGLTKNLISTKQSDFKILTEQNISDLVKNYDFQGNTGIGLLFFVEAMDRDTETEGLWVAFVNMSTKTVLLSAYEKAKTGGMGFRNNWADATYKILLAMNDDFYKWQKDTK